MIIRMEISIYFSEIESYVYYKSYNFQIVLRKFRNYALREKNEENSYQIYKLYSENLELAP